MRTLCWNARGANNNGTIDFFKTILSTHNFSLCGILEPMTGHDNLSHFARKVGFKNYLHGGEANSKIWVLWRDSVEVTFIKAGNQFISVSVQTDMNIQYTCTFVYASTSVSVRQNLWHDLLDMSSSITGPWIVAGDFNTISSGSEKKGGAAQAPGSMSDFNEFQMDCGLSDAGYTGSKFTWSNNRSEDHQIWMRLDRVLINGATLAMLPVLKVEHLARIASDHAPLLINLGDSVRRPASFKYIRAWHDHPDFLTTVEAIWNAHAHAHANPILAFALKLQRLRRHLKTWNWTVFGNISKRINLLTHKIEALELDIQTNWNSSTETLLINSRTELAITQRQHYQLLADKAKAQWVADGDRNSTLFHAIIKARQARNVVSIALPDGSHSNDRNIIGNLAQDHFQRILGGFSVRPPPDALSDIQPIITEEDNENLTSSPDDQEIHEAILKLNPSSAPGPDGFTGHFYTHCWHIVKGDMLKAVQAFFYGLHLPNAITATNLVLIPKKHFVTLVDQFRPISLCNFFHKVISSILNSRLARVLPRIISQEQSGFMPGRNMVDSIALAHDLTCHINKGHRGGGNVIIKVDMSKAYDRVSWLFLLRMLDKASLGHCKLIFIISSLLAYYGLVWRQVRVEPKGVGSVTRVPVRTRAVFHLNPLRSSHHTRMCVEEELASYEA
ncbi:unnamed protein product [Rhodiola kirilowii]